MTQELSFKSQNELPVSRFSAIHERQRGAFGPITGFENIRVGDLVKIYYNKNGKEDQWYGVILGIGDTDEKGIRYNNGALHSYWRRTAEEALREFKTRQKKYKNLHKLIGLSGCFSGTFFIPTVISRGHLKADSYSAAIHERQRPAIEPPDDLDPKLRQGDIVSYLIENKVQDIEWEELPHIENEEALAVVLDTTYDGVWTWWDGDPYLDVIEDTLRNRPDEVQPWQMERIKITRIVKDKKCSNCGWTFADHDICPYCFTPYPSPIKEPRIIKRDLKIHPKILETLETLRHDKKYSAAVHKAQRGAFRGKIVTYDKLLPGDLVWTYRWWNGKWTPVPDAYAPYGVVIQVGGIHDNDNILDNRKVYAKFCKTKEEAEQVFPGPYVMTPDTNWDGSNAYEILKRGLTARKSYSAAVHSKQRDAVGPDLLLVKHKLIIDSPPNGRAHCSCGYWCIIQDRMHDAEDINPEFSKHIKEILDLARHRRREKEKFSAAVHTAQQDAVKQFKEDWMRVQIGDLVKACWDGKSGRGCEYGVIVNIGDKDGKGIYMDCALHAIWRPTEKEALNAFADRQGRLTSSLNGKNWVPEIISRGHRAFSAAVHAAQRDAVKFKPFIAQSFDQLRRGDLVEHLPSTIYKYGIILELIKSGDGLNFDTLLSGWFDDPETAKKRTVELDYSYSAYEFEPGDYAVLERDLPIGRPQKFSAAIHEAQREAARPTEPKIIDWIIDWPPMIGKCEVCGTKDSVYRCGHCGKEVCGDCSIHCTYCDAAFCPEHCLEVSTGVFACERCQEEESYSAAVHSRQRDAAKEIKVSEINALHIWGYLKPGNREYLLRDAGISETRIEQLSKLDIKMVPDNVWKTVSKFLQSKSLMFIRYNYVSGDDLKGFDDIFDLDFKAYGAAVHERQRISALPTVDWTEIQAGDFVMVHQLDGKWPTDYGVIIYKGEFPGPYGGTFGHDYSLWAWWSTNIDEALNHFNKATPEMLKPWTENSYPKGRLSYRVGRNKGVVYTILSRGHETVKAYGAAVHSAQRDAATKYGMVDMYGPISGEWLAIYGSVELAPALKEQQDLSGRGLKTYLRKDEPDGYILFVYKDDWDKFNKNKNYAAAVHSRQREAITNKKTRIYLSEAGKKLYNDKTCPICLSQDHAYFTIPPNVWAPAANPAFKDSYYRKYCKECQCCFDEYWIIQNKTARKAMVSVEVIGHYATSGNPDYISTIQVFSAAIHIRQRDAVETALYEGDHPTEAGAAIIWDMVNTEHREYLLNDADCARWVFEQNGYTKFKDLPFNVHVRVINYLTKETDLNFIREHYISIKDFPKFRKLFPSDKYFSAAVHKAQQDAATPLVKFPDEPFKMVRTFRLKRGGKGKVVLELNIKKGTEGRDWDTLEPVMSRTLSISGSIYSYHGRDEGGGPCQDRIRPDEYVDSDELGEIIDIWNTWHLNDVHAGTKQQTAALGAPCPPDIDSWTWTKDELKKAGLLVDRGYSYGSEWLIRPLPDSVISETVMLFGGPENIRPDTSLYSAAIHPAQRDAAKVVCETGPSLFMMITSLKCTDCGRHLGLVTTNLTTELDDGPHLNELVLECLECGLAHEGKYVDGKMKVVTSMNQPEELELETCETCHRRVDHYTHRCDRGPSP